MIVYALSCGAILALRPQALGGLLRTPSLWWLVLASGTTNAAFNWGVVIGDVVRVVLLFYLMPLWAVLLARLVLGERLTAGAALRVVLGLAGAAVVLWPSGDVWRAARLPDALGLVGGFAFALNNVMLRREAGRPEACRALAMFVGGVLVAGVLAATLAARGAIGWPPAPAPAAGWVGLALLLAALFLASNLALQYGAARLPAQVTAVVMLTEIVFAGGSALALGAGELTPRLVLGALLILGGALLSTLSRR